MSFVLSGPAWWRQLKQTHDPSGAGVINCHMWMNKGAILKPFVVFVNVFHLSLKRPNDFVVSWCMWLVALQNEGNSSQLYISIYFPECLVFSFGGSEFTFFSTFVLHMQAKYLISIKTQHQFSQPYSQPAYTSFPTWEPKAKIKSGISAACEIKATVLSSTSSLTSV